ncbi:hypothetical protein CRUP_001862, partial [Coryphaenoides rupestris]
MVGLRNRSTWEPLLLKASCIRSCANGCSLGVTTDLIYANTDSESVEGVFVYPLGEKEVVVGFEAVIAGRLVGVQIQSRGKLKDCCLDCCPGAGLPGGGDGGCGSGGDGREWGGCCGGSGLDMKCTNGHLILDEDLERTTFIVGTGAIGPMEIVSIIISTTLELPTLENGAIRIAYPSLLTPVVTGQPGAGKSENGGKSDEIGSRDQLFRRNLGKPERVLGGSKHTGTSCFGATSGKPERVLGGSKHTCAHAIFTSPAANRRPNELNFPLLVRGPAYWPSPTHALRADADPSAQSASSTYITLAQEHPYDRHIEVILHLSAPVLMLNFCPDLLAEPLELHRATRELVFLIDRSGSMSGCQHPPRE